MATLSTQVFSLVCFIQEKKRISSLLSHVMMVIFSSAIVISTMLLGIIFEDFYCNDVADFDSIINNIMSCLWYVGNLDLLAPLDEYKVALFSMHSNKSPRLDGLNPIIYIKKIMAFLWS